MGRLCTRVSDAEDGQCEAGAFAFADGYDGTKDVDLLFGCPCPCGCGELRAVTINPLRSGSRRPVWTWDGNREAPTLAPSILICQLDERGRPVGEHWHGFLVAGHWNSC